MSFFVQYSPILLQWCLILIMFGMGMTLTFGDFRRIFGSPKAVTVGLLNQLLGMPLLALLLVTAIPMRLEISLGLMIIALCPDGAASNLISYLSKGDLAQAISLTILTSLITVFTIPPMVNLAIAHLAGANGNAFQMDVPKAVFDLFKLTILPIAVGMALRHFFSETVQQLEKGLAWLAAICIGLALFVIALKVQTQGSLLDLIWECGGVVLLLNLLTMLAGFWASRWSNLNFQQSITNAIEGGIQNGVTGITVASVLMNQPKLAIVSGVYALVMIATGLGVVWWSRRQQA